MYKGILKKRMLALWFIVASVTMTASMFSCKDVQSYKEMADVQIGFPVPFLSVSFQRYTPFYFPEDFCGPGSPWEDPQRIMLLPVLINYVLMFVLFYGVWRLLELRKK